MSSSSKVHLLYSDTEEDGYQWKLRIEVKRAVQEAEWSWRVDDGPIHTDKFWGQGGDPNWYTSSSELSLEQRKEIAEGETLKLKYGDYRRDVNIYFTSFETPGAVYKIIEAWVEEGTRPVETPE